MVDQPATQQGPTDAVVAAAAPGPMRSLSHGLTVLTALSRAAGSIGLTELADRVQLHRSTVHRVLSTFIEHGLVRRDDEHRYAIGLAAIELARATGYSPVADDPISQEITALHLRTRARAIYAVPRFGRMACVVASERGEVSFPIVPQHALLPLHSTAAGKAYLAFRPDAEVARELAAEPYQATTEHTATSALELQRALRAVRSRGYATEVREFSADGRAVGVPVYDRGRSAVASVAVGLPDSISTDEQVAIIVTAATESAHRIADLLFGAPGTGD